MTGTVVYIRVSANRGSNYSRIGAVDNRIVYGMPALPGVATFAHIHARGLHLSPRNDTSRVFCLCWHHHQGCCDRGYISTMELLQVEEIWIQNKRRSQPHPRDVALMKRAENGEVVRQCAGMERWDARRPVANLNFSPQTHQVSLF